MKQTTIKRLKNVKKLDEKRNNLSFLVELCCFPVQCLEKCSMVSVYVLINKCFFQSCMYLDHRCRVESIWTTDVGLIVFGRMNDVTHAMFYVRQLNFRDVHLGLRTSNVLVQMKRHVPRFA